MFYRWHDSPYFSGKVSPSFTFRRTWGGSGVRRWTSPTCDIFWKGRGHHWKWLQWRKRHYVKEQVNVRCVKGSVVDYYRDGLRFDGRHIYQVNRKVPMPIRIKTGNESPFPLSPSIWVSCLNRSFLQSMDRREENDFVNDVKKGKGLFRIRN